MPRSDDDTWDLATSVGATATLVAAARALASRRDDPLIDDPFAEPLVRAVGIDAFSRVLDGADGADGVPIDTAEGVLIDTAEGVLIDTAEGVLIDMVAVRTRFYDDFFADAGAVGLRQAVILASGLDARAYRLAWPPGLRLFEVDQPRVVEFKSAVLAARGAAPRADLRTVGADLRDDWAAALRDAGFDRTEPTAWIAEGLLVYLPPDAQDRLLDTITSLSAPGSRLATEYHPDGGSGIARRASDLSARLAREGLDLNLGELFYQSGRRPVIEHLEHLGWEVSSRPRAEMFAAYGRPFPTDPSDQVLRNSFALSAIRKATT